MLVLKKSRRHTEPWLCDIILILFVILRSKNNQLECLFSLMQLTRLSLILFLEDNMMTLLWDSIQNAFKEIQLLFGKDRFLSSNVAPLYAKIAPHLLHGPQECKLTAVVSLCSEFKLSSQILLPSYILSYLMLKE